MFLKNLFYKKPQELNLLYTTDIHSHLFYGIDDGVNTIDGATEIIREMANLGFERLVITPHVRREIYENTSDVIKSKLGELQNHLIKNNIDIEIQAAAEYYVDDGFYELVKSNNILTFGNNKHVLIEFSYFNPPINIKNTIYDLQLKGYHVVLAHAERYYYFHNNIEVYYDLYERGVLLQLNLVSINSFYDRKSAKIAKTLVEKGLYSFIGSDMHNMQYFKSFKKILYSAQISEIFEKCNIQNDDIFEK